MSSNEHITIDHNTIVAIVAILILFGIFYWMCIDNGAVVPNATSDDIDVENFTIYSYPKYCTNCGSNNRRNCNNCTNCGYCITPNGRGECVPGDSNGPYFREDCIGYEHTSPRYNIGRVYPYWRRDGYYYDPRGYPRTTRRRRLTNPKYRPRYGSGSRTDWRTRYGSGFRPGSRSGSRSGSQLGSRSGSK